MAKRKGGGRKGWRSLKPSTRKRIEGAGRSGKLTGQPLSDAQTRLYWESGGDLRSGRGHAVRRQYQGPTDAAERLGRGMGQPTDYAAVRDYQPPRWMLGTTEPIGADTRVLLSKHGPVNQWRDVTVVTNRNGRSMMTVHYRNPNQYPTTTELSNYDQVREVGRFLHDTDYDGLDAHFEQETTDGGRAGTPGGKGE